MDIHLIAVHYSDKQKKNIAAFRLLDADNGQVIDQPYNAVYNVVSSGKAVIDGIKFDKSKGDIKGSNGAFDRYPGLYNGNLMNNSLVIIASLDDIGFVVSNFKGMTTSALYKDVLNFANKISIANGKIVTKDNKQFISAINGEYLNKPASSDKKMQKINKEVKYSKELKENINKAVNKNNNIRFARVITGTPNPNSKLKEFDEISGMTVEQKLTYTMLAMKYVRPFYYSIYNTLNRVEANPKDGIKTMAVSLDTLYFNSEFVKEKSLPDLLFIKIHEICHIAMRHRVREKGREHDIWNQACDYYINKCIADEFGLKEPGDIKVAKPKVENSAEIKYRIALPEDCLFNSNIDIYKDTPESIYEELMRALNQNDDNNSENNNSGSDNSSNSNESQSSSGNGNSSSNNTGDEQNKSEGQNSSSSQDNDSNGDNNGNGSESDLEKLSKGQDVGDEQEGNSSSNNRKDDDNNKSGQNTVESAEESNENDNKTKGRLVGKMFRGEEIKEYQDDIVDDNNSKGMSSEQMAQRAQSLLNRAVTLHKQTNQFGGPSGDFLERMVERALAPKVDWRTLLKNKLTLASQKVNTFAAPDKRFRSRNMIMPGPKKLDNDSLENIKICCDTSGSISDKDLGIVFAQIEQLFKNYKAEAEMLYWDTSIRAIYPFKDIKDLVSKKPMGGGGTDVNCVFEYFENDRDYKIGKKKKPSIIIIFTDGVFGAIHDKYKKYRDVIWVVKDNPSFKAPFGAIAPFKNED